MHVPSLHWNWSAVQLDDAQPSSSSPPAQSGSPSHTQKCGMHVPSSHVNSVELHAVVAEPDPLPLPLPPTAQPASSPLSGQSGCPSHTLLAGMQVRSEQRISLAPH